MRSFYGQAYHNGPFLTVMAVMTGGTQLVEVTHWTGGTRFCRESIKSRVFYDRGSENTLQKINMVTSLSALLFFIVHINIAVVCVYSYDTQLEPITNRILHIAISGTSKMQRDVTCTMCSSQKHHIHKLDVVFFSSCNPY